MYDVMVIGAGPAGSRVAYRLAKNGHNVVVLDKKRNLAEPVCCTGILGQECASAFDIDTSVTIRQVNSARLFSPSGKLLKIQRQATQAFIIDRGKFNVSLAAKAQIHGAHYSLQTSVQGLEIASDRIIAGCTYQEKKVIYEARAAVLASGFSPSLTHHLNLGKISDFVTGAQVEVEVKHLDEVEVYFGHEIAPGFFGWLVPTQGNRGLIGLLSRRHPGIYLEKLISSLKSQGTILSDGAKPGYGLIPLKPLPRTYTDRLLVIGDAAGQVKPTTGGGIYYGLLSADTAADTLTRALESGDFSAKSLSIYERRWKKRLGRELKVGYWARKLYERLGDRQIDIIFDILTSHGIADAVVNSAELSFDWHGEALLKTVSHAALSQVFGLARLPFRLTRR